MQPPTAPPRDALTTAQVVGVIQNASGVIVGKGLELTDMSLIPVRTIADDLVSGSITRNSYATLHATGQLAVATTLDWGNAIVRPFITLTDGVVKARFNLGAYFTSSDLYESERSPVIHDVQCYDILSVLNDPVGSSYAVPAGAAYLAEVEAILISRGVRRYVIDQTAAASVLPADRVWVFNDQTTWLIIVNDLLGSVGYQGIWSDWDGAMRCMPYLTPVRRAPEWTYDTGALTSMLTRQRAIERDYYDAPNRWVFYRSNNVDGPAPVEGNGLFSYINETRGPTSVSARGRTITRPPIGLDVVDHAALVARAQPIIDADIAIPTHIRVGTFPNPLHWHFDKLVVNDPGLGLAMPAEVLCTSWTLDLPPASTMTQAWTVL